MPENHILGNIIPETISPAIFSSPGVNILDTPMLFGGEKRWKRKKRKYEGKRRKTEKKGN
jgi:hypothetical protein